MLGASWRGGRSGALPTMPSPLQNSGRMLASSRLNRLTKQRRCGDFSDKPIPSSQGNGPLNLLFDGGFEESWPRSRESDLCRRTRKRSLNMMSSCPDGQHGSNSSRPDRRSTPGWPTPRPESSDELSTRSILTEVFHQHDAGFLDFVLNIQNGLAIGRYRQSEPGGLR